MYDRVFLQKALSRHPLQAYRRVFCYDGEQFYRSIFSHIIRQIWSVSCEVIAQSSPLRSIEALFICFLSAFVPCDLN
jgi:hypothetical protein